METPKFRWLVATPAGIGATVVGIVAPTVLATTEQTILFYAGLALLGWSGLAAIWYFWRHGRKTLPDEQQEYERRALSRRVDARLEADSAKNRIGNLFLFWEAFKIERDRQQAERIEPPNDPS